MKILLVDDDKENRRALLRRLEDGGHEVVTANSKSQGLGYLQHWQPELVIVDLDMGAGNDGLKLIEEANQPRSKTKFWLVSSGMTEEISAEAKRLGAQQAISKSSLIMLLKEMGFIA